MVSKPEEAKKSIIRWLEEEGAFKEEKETPGYHYTITAEYKPGTGRVVSIYQKEESADKVLITSGMSFDESMKKRFEEMEDREDLLKELRYGLLRMPGNFNLIMDGDILEEVRLSNFVFYDALGKDRLIRALEEDWKKFLFITWKVKEHLGRK
ncbi:MAG: DUF2299 domain-containing protein [Euryarchaeota archaeon]|nr:DUF2299 domain-containing protein [Euryarchaeota archaeon]